MLPGDGVHLAGELMLWIRNKFREWAGRQSRCGFLKQLYPDTLWHINATKFTQLKPTPYFAMCNAHPRFIY